MPEETIAPAAPDAPAVDAPEPDAPDEKPDGNEWFREKISGLPSQPAESRPSRNQQWAEANAELRRGRTGGAKAAPDEGEPSTDTDKGSEPPASRPERDETELDRRVQAEVDRREAVRNQRAEAQRERDLRRNDPAAYAKYKEEQEAATSHISNLTGALKQLAGQFDEAAVTPLVQSLPEKIQAEVLKDPGHGIDGRKEIVKRAIAALKKSAYDEGEKAGRESAQKSLRKSSAFRKELLTELRDGEEEPELAQASGTSRNADWDMNDWMRAMTGRNGTASRNGRASRE